MIHATNLKRNLKYKTLNLLFYICKIKEHRYECDEKDYIAKLSGFLFKYLFPSKNKEDLVITGERTVGYDNKKHAFYLL